MRAERSLPTVVFGHGGRRVLRRSLLVVAMVLVAAAWVTPSLADDNPPSSQEALTAPEAGWVLQSASSPMDDCAAGDGVCLYENPNYTGTWVRLTGPGAFVDFAYFGVAINNKASSIRFVGNHAGGKFVATLYDYAAYGGAWTAFGADDADLGDNEIGHDRASSIYITSVPQCTGDGLYLYEHVDYGGRCRKFAGSTPDLRGMAFDNIASSLRLVGSFAGTRRVTLCDNAGYAGTCSAFTADTSNLGLAAIGHDRTSSLQIETVSAGCTTGQYRAEYFNNRWLSGSPAFTRCESSINNNWDVGGPGGGVGSDNFSVRWTGRFAFGGGTYTFIARADDGIRLWVDGALLIDQWHDTSVTEYRADRSLAAGEHEVKVEYYENAGGSVAQVRWEAASGACGTGQYRAEYFDNRWLSGSPAFVRCESSINYDWGTGGPGGGVGSDRFSARWTGRFVFGAGTYTFIARADDGIRLWVDGVQIINQWQDQAPTEFRVDRVLTAGEHEIKVSHYENTGGAVAQVRWEPTSGVCGTGQYRAEYFNNRWLSGSPAFTRCEPSVNYDWGTGGPGGGVGNDAFSARWTGRFAFGGGAYTFIALADDGIRVWVDGALVIDQWRDQAPTEYQVNRTLSAGEHDVKVEYYENSGGAVAQVRWESTSGLCTTGQYRAEYFNNRTLSGSPAFTRCETSIGYDWGTGGPGGGLGADNFSVRWTGRFTFGGGVYSFVARADDGIRLWVDGASLVDQWHDQSVTEYRADRSLSAGEHEVKVEYYENAGGAVAQVRWEPTSGACVTNQYRAEYFGNRTLSGTPTFVRCETSINYDWGTGGPGGGVGNDDFSARWVGRFGFNSGSHTFIARADDGIRLWVDGALVIDQWRDQAVSEFRATRTLSAGEHEIKVEHYENAGGAVAQVWWERTSASCPVGQYRAQYYNNRSLSGSPTFTRCETSIANDWGLGGPGGGLGVDNFSVRWSGRFWFPGGNKTFIAVPDDGMRVWLDTDLIFDQWQDQSAQEHRFSHNVGAGEHEVTVEYYEHGNAAVAKFRWE